MTRLALATRSRKSRSCETMSWMAGWRSSWRSSHSTASRSRWLVGSSSSSRSLGAISTQARFRRIFQPPESSSTVRASCACPKPRPSSSSAARASAEGPPAGVGLAQRLTVVAGLGLLDGLFGGHQGGIGVHHEAYRADAGAWRMLGQPGNAQPGQVNVALFRGEIAPQQCQQRALAAAVGADEGYALTRVDDERGVGKEGAPGAGQAEVVEADQGRARSVSGRQKAGPGWPASP